MDRLISLTTEKLDRKFLARSNKAGKPTQRNNQSEKKLAIFQTVVNGRELSLLHLLNRKAEEW